MDTKVVWQGKMAFDAASKGGFSIPLDTSVESGGEDNGIRPTELLLLALAGCTGMDVISILTKKRQDITAFEVRIADFTRAEDHPRVFTHVVLEYVVTGHNVDRTAVERAVELSAEKYCTVQGTISKVTQVDSRIVILEAEVQ